MMLKIIGGMLMMLVAMVLLIIVAAIGAKFLENAGDYNEPLEEIKEKLYGNGENKKDRQP